MHEYIIELAFPIKCVQSVLRGLLLIFPVLFGMTNWLGVTGVWLTMLVVELLTLGVSMYALWIYQKRYLQTN
jgi:hypothetical protein